MKNEFVLAFNEVIDDKQLPKEVVLEALQAAMVSAYRRTVNASNAQLIEADIDLETGEFVLFAEKEVVDNVQDDRTEVALETACEVDANASVGDMVVVETTPKNFGRVAAQTARQVIQQRIREAERDAQLDHYGQQLGEIVSGAVQALNSQAVTLGLDKKAEGIMPRNQQIPGERFRVHDRVRALLLEVKATSRGPQIILSRAHRNFLRRLLENEVPEIYHGLVEIRSIAREPGQRSKVAVSALQPGVDPVGACVGIRGVRIQAIVRELSDEKIDVIEWNNDPVAYIAKALSPARVTGVYLDEYTKGTKTATVVVPEDQLSLAIGRDGQNARLAAKLTTWRIDIKSLPEAAVDAIFKLQNDPEFIEITEQEVEFVPQIEIILAKKAEGRPVTPEEYKLLSKFVERVESGLIQKRKKEREADEERKRIAQASIPKAAYKVPIEESGISLRFCNVLGGAGYTTIGDLMLQMKLDPDVVFAAEGIGPKAMEEIEEMLAHITFPEAEEEIEPEIEPVEAEHIEVEEAPAPVEEATAEKQAEVEVIAEHVEEEIEPAAAVITTETEVEVVEKAASDADVGEVDEVVVKKAEAQPVEMAEEAPEEEAKSFDELFALQPSVLEIVEPLDEDDAEGELDQAPRKKKKKKKYVEMEYDPDQDVVVVKKKRKRSGSEDWEEELDI